MMLKSLAAVLVALSIGSALHAEGTESAAWTDTFEGKENLVPYGANPFFVLKPGYTLEYAGGTKAKKVRLVITVLKTGKVVDGVKVAVVEEREWLNGKLTEVSRNYLAISRTTNNVYYFGEDVDEYEGGKVTGHGGSWLSGVDGARYGLMMPGKPEVGARYYQEVAPGKAMDRAEVVSLGDVISTPAGKFAGCLRTEETTPLEPGTSGKAYAPGVGLIQDGNLRLVKQSQGRARR
jgi:hypothetical protein